MYSPPGPSSYSSWNSPLPAPAVQPIPVTSPYCWSTQSPPTTHSPSRQTQQASPTPNSSPAHQYHGHSSPKYQPAPTTNSPEIQPSYQPTTSPVSPASIPAYAPHFNASNIETSSTQYHSSPSLHSPSQLYYQAGVNPNYCNLASSANWHHGEVGYYPNTYNYQSTEYILPDGMYSQMEPIIYNHSLEGLGQHSECVSGSIDHKSCGQMERNTEHGSPSAPVLHAPARDEKYTSSSNDNEEYHKKSPCSNSSQWF